MNRQRARGRTTAKVTSLTKRIISVERNAHRRRRGRTAVLEWAKSVSDAALANAQSADALIRVRMAPALNPTGITGPTGTDQTLTYLCAVGGGYWVLVSTGGVVPNPSFYSKAGAYFISATTACPINSVSNILFVPGTGFIAYDTTGSQYSISSDGGKNWGAATNATNPAGVPRFGLAMCPFPNASSPTAYVGVRTTAATYISTSTDGTTWANTLAFVGQGGEGLTSNGKVVAVLDQSPAAPPNPKTVIVSDDPTNAGSWETYTIRPTNLYADGYIASRPDGQMLYVDNYFPTSADAYVWMSGDNGQSWNRSDTIPTPPGGTFNVIYAWWGGQVWFLSWLGTFSGVQISGIAYSQNGYNKWTVITEGPWGSPMNGRGTFFSPYAKASSDNTYLITGANGAGYVYTLAPL